MSVMLFYFAPLKKVAWSEVRPLKMKKKYLATKKIDPEKD
jgi:hypothetical protein